MSRKISQEAIDSFISNIPFKKANTSVEITFAITRLYLHGYEIAKRDGSGNLMITAAGWLSNTTKERLNALPNVYIYQKNKVWYLNGEKWDGTWKSI